MKKQKKPRYDADWGPRPFSGYTDYRYGSGKPVTLKPIFAGEKREHLINKTMDVMSDWRFTPFEYEGSARAGLRSGLCLQGYPWRLADFEAATLVETSLSRMGAKRPTWEEGQPDHTDSPDFCSWCRGPLDSEALTRKQRFCSSECAMMAIEHRDRKSNTYGGVVLRAAYRLIAKEKAPPRDCEYCGKTFKSDREGARFCSTKCIARWQKGDLLLKDIVCEGCGKTCKPAHRLSTFCSRSCRSSVILGRARERVADETRRCKCCGDPFTPTVNAILEVSIYCSAACASVMAKRAWYQRTYVVKEHHLVCTWCGEGYVSKMPWSTTCGPECRRKVNALTSPSKRSRMTPQAFDYFITRPVAALPYPRPITAGVFDKFIGLAA